jgi:hypothetical protein
VLILAFVRSCPKTAVAQHHRLNLRGAKSSEESHPKRFLWKFKTTHDPKKCALDNTCSYRWHPGLGFEVNSWAKGRNNPSNMLLERWAAETDSGIWIG